MLSELAHTGTNGHAHTHTQSHPQRTNTHCAVRYRRSISIPFHREVLLSMKKNVQEIIQDELCHTSSQGFRQRHTHTHTYNDKYTHTQLTRQKIWGSPIWGKYVTEGNLALATISRFSLKWPLTPVRGCALLLVYSFVSCHPYTLKLSQRLRVIIPM